MENNDSEDFFSIGMGFVTPGVETGVPQSETIDKKEESPTQIVCNSIKENCENADKSIQEDKEKNEIIVETIKKDEDSAIEENENSSESYLEKNKKSKIFSFEDAYESVLVTENINSASNKELKTIGNILILTKKLISYYKKQEKFCDQTDNPSTIILQNKIKDGRGINVCFSYLNYKNNSLEDSYNNLLQFLNYFTNNGEIGDIISSIQYLGTDVLKIFDDVVPNISTKIYAGDKNISEDLDKLIEYISSDSGCSYVMEQLFGLKYVPTEPPINTVVDDINLIDILVETRNKIIDANLSDSYETALENIKNITEHNDITIEFFDKLLIEKVTQLAYQYTKIIECVIENFCKDTGVLFDSTIDETQIKQNESKEGIKFPF